MRFLFLVPGTGNFFCGSCLRDNDLARALRELGHAVDVQPLYLPFHLEEEKQQREVQLGGINLYLAYRKLGRLVPRWLARRLDRPGLLRWAARRGQMTDAGGLGPLTLAMLRGEDGPTKAEIGRLTDSLEHGERPDVIVLSNAMLCGLAHALKRAFDVPLLCTLQGEAPFLDAIEGPERELCWSEIQRGGTAVDRFIAVSQSYGDLMAARLGIAPERMDVVLNGVDPALYPEREPAEVRARHGSPLAIGFLARQCRDKGLHTLVDAFVELERSGRRRGARLFVSGVELPEDRPFVLEQKKKLAEAGLEEAVSFHPNVTREEKLRLLASASIFSVPATYGESFGLPVIEAMASGAAVVQPRSGAFPEILERTGGGLLCEPDDPASLADGLGRLLEDGELRATLAEAGRRSVLAHFTHGRMAREIVSIADAVREAHRRPAPLHT